jgi:hypothetical protein
MRTVPAIKQPKICNSECTIARWPRSPSTAFYGAAAAAQRREIVEQTYAGCLMPAQEPSTALCDDCSRILRLSVRVSIRANDLG